VAQRFAVLQLQLVDGVLDVELDGVQADAAGAGNHAVAHAVAHAVDDLPLGGCEHVGMR
jgi:hypothetical protein